MKRTFERSWWGYHSYLPPLILVVRHANMNQTLLIFSIVAFIGIATPGSTVLLALTNGFRYSLRASVPGMLGAVLSDFVLISAVAIGLGALLAASEFWFSVVKWVGVSYLAYLGIRLLERHACHSRRGWYIAVPLQPRSLPV